jgi:hypothetical protein
MPLCDAIAVVDLIGTAAMVHSTDDDSHSNLNASIPARTTIGRSYLPLMVRTIEEAHPYLIDWPQSYYKLLDGVAGRNAKALQEALASPTPLRPRHIFATQIGQLLRRPPRGLDGTPIAALAQAIRSYCIERWNMSPQPLRFSRQCKTARAVGPAVSVAKAAQHLGVKPNEHLAQIVRETLAAYDTGPKIEKQELVGLIFADIRHRWTDHSENTCKAKRTNLIRKVNGVEILSAHQAEILLDGNKTCTYRMRDWEECGAIFPIPGEHIVGSLKYYYKSDVDRLVDYLSSLATPISDGRVPDGFVAYGSDIRRIYGGGVRRVDVLKNILSRQIPIASLVPRPSLGDIYFDLNSAIECAWQVRINILIEKDPFAPIHYARTLASALWEGNHPAFDRYVREKKHFRSQIRFLPLRNTQGGRDRPKYHYSSVDLLLLEYHSGNETKFQRVNAILKGTPSRCR